MKDKPLGYFMKDKPVATQAFGRRTRKVRANQNVRVAGWRRRKQIWNSCNQKKSTYQGNKSSTCNDSVANKCYVEILFGMKTYKLMDTDTWERY